MQGLHVYVTSQLYQSLVLQEKSWNLPWIVTISPNFSIIHLSLRLNTMSIFLPLPSCNIFIFTLIFMQYLYFTFVFSTRLILIFDILGFIFIFALMQYLYLFKFIFILNWVHTTIERVVNKITDESHQIVVDSDHKFCVSGLIGGKIRTIELVNSTTNLT